LAEAGHDRVALVTNSETEKRIIAATAKRRAKTFFIHLPFALLLNGFIKWVTPGQDYSLSMMQRKRGGHSAGQILRQTLIMYGVKRAAVIV
jgi:hypothetical protein